MTAEAAGCYIQHCLYVPYSCTAVCNTVQPVVLACIKQLYLHAMSQLNDVSISIVLLNVTLPNTLMALQHSLKTQ
jgi:hypothetical protein